MSSPLKTRSIQHSISSVSEHRLNFNAEQSSFGIVAKQERQIELSDDDKKNKEDENLETESLKESDLGSLQFD